jgi:hypothetical protein
MTDCLLVQEKNHQDPLAAHMRELVPSFLKMERNMIETITDGTYHVQKGTKAWDCYFHCSVNHAAKGASTQSRCALEETFIDTIGSANMSLTVGNHVANPTTMTDDVLGHKV